MVKIFNVPMAKLFLEYNPDRKLYDASIYSNRRGQEVTLDDLDKLEDEWQHKFYTQDLGGSKWYKYSELDLFPVKDTTIEEFLYLGYNTVISILKEESDTHEKSLVRNSEEQDRLCNTIQQQDKLIESLINSIKESKQSPHYRYFKKQFDKFEDPYKCNLLVFKKDRIPSELEDYIESMNFITHSEESQNGYIAFWGFGD